MRLICPNCGAQYAVTEDVIPAAGRDVQCSNCAHTWFETPGASSDDNPPAPRKPRPTSKPEPTANAGRFEGSIADAFKDDDPSLAPAPQAPAKRKTVDPSVASILQEEAERESAKRRQEAPAAIEDQADLGLNAPTATSPRPEFDTTREAAKTAAAATGAVATGAAAATRRELLPDIEEINSSLRSDSERADSGDLAGHTADQRVQKKRGFRRGFLSVLLLIAICVVIYVQAEALKSTLPTLAGSIDSYVATVDAGRTWLDETVRGMLTSAEDPAPES